MPTLPIGNGKGRTALYDPSWVIAAMVFPRDERRQRQYIARLVEYSHGITEENIRSGKRKIRAFKGMSPAQISASMGALIGQEIGPLGGFGLLADAPSFGELTKETQTAVWPGCVAGDMMLWLAEMHQNGLPASVRKAIRVARAYYSRTTARDGTNPGSSIRYLQDQWERFKPSAHMWAVYRLWMTGGSPQVKPEEFSPFEQKTVPLFLSIAEGVLSTVLEIRPHTTTAPLLDVNSVWTAPEEYPLNEGAGVRPGRDIPAWIKEAVQKPFG